MNEGGWAALGWALAIGVVGFDVVGFFVLAAWIHGAPSRARGRARNVLGTAEGDAGSSDGGPYV